MNRWVFPAAFAFAATLAGAQPKEGELATFATRDTKDVQQRLELMTHTLYAQEQQVITIRFRQEYGERVKMKLAWLPAKDNSLVPAWVFTPATMDSGKRYPAIGQAWRRAWDNVIPFFAFAPGVRKMIYTTNAVEALHRSLRKIIKTRGSFPNDDSALKLLYLAIKNAGMRWRRGIEWTAAMGQFAIQFGERFPGTAR